MNPYGYGNQYGNQYGSQYGSYGGYGAQQPGSTYTISQRISQQQQTEKKDTKPQTKFQKIMKKHKKLIVCLSIVLIVLLAVLINVIMLQPKTIYYVTFHANGAGASFMGDNIALTLKSDGISPGSKVAIPKDPGRTGYKFIAWYRDMYCSGTAWDFTIDTVTSDITLYAKWEALPVSVSFTYIGEPAGGATSIRPIDFTYGEKYGELAPEGKLPVLTQVGYDFDGWWTKDNIRVDGTGALVQDDQPHHLTARWKGKAITVVLNTNRDSYNTSANRLPSKIDKDVFEVHHGQTYGDIPEPSWEGWTFAGWWLTPEPIGGDNGTEITGSETVTDLGERTLYARWELAPTIFRSDLVKGSAVQYDTVETVIFAEAQIEGVDYDIPNDHFNYKVTPNTSLPGGLGLVASNSVQRNRLTGHVTQNAGITTFSITAQHVNHPDLVGGNFTAVETTFEIEIQKRALAIPSLVKVNDRETVATPDKKTDVVGEGNETPGGTYIAYTYKKGEVREVGFDSVGQLHLGKELFVYEPEDLRKEAASYGAEIGHRYEVCLTLTQPNNYEWSQVGLGGQNVSYAIKGENLYLGWIIDRQSIEIPEIHYESSVYSGLPHARMLKNLSNNTFVQLTNKQFDLDGEGGEDPVYEWKGPGSDEHIVFGSYDSTVSIFANMRKNYKWAVTGETAAYPGVDTDQGMCSWSISKANLQVPTLAYDSLSQTAIEPDGRREVDLGSFIYNTAQRTASFMLRGDIITNRSGDALDEHNMSGNIGNTSNIPRGPIGSGGVEAPLYLFKNTGGYATSATNVGDYSFAMEIADPNNYTWSWNSEGTKVLPWKINKFQVAAPDKNTGFTITANGSTERGLADTVFDGSLKTVALDSVPSPFTDQLYSITASTFFQRTAAGNYNGVSHKDESGGTGGTGGIEIMLIDYSNFEWKQLGNGAAWVSNGGNMHYGWTIKPRVVALPSLTVTGGSVATNSWTSNNSVLTVSGNYNSNQQQVNFTAETGPLWYNTWTNAALYEVDTASANRIGVNAFGRIDAQLNAKNYIKLLDKNNTVWATLNNTGNLTINWTINTIKLEVPPVTNDMNLNRTYDGDIKTIALPVAEHPVRLKYGEGDYRSSVPYGWSALSTAALSIITTAKEITGTSLCSELSRTDATSATQTSDTVTLTISLVDTVNFAWTTSAGTSKSWKISKKTVNLPPDSEFQTIFTGGSHIPGKHLVINSSMITSTTEALLNLSPNLPFVFAAPPVTNPMFVDLVSPVQLRVAIDDTFLLNGGFDAVNKNHPFKLVLNDTYNHTWGANIPGVTGSSTSGERTFSGSAAWIIELRV